MNDELNFSDENINPPSEEMQAREATHEREIEFPKKSQPSEAMKAEPSAWLSREERDQLRSKWSSIQAQFVDQPRSSVEQAETLAADAVDRIKQFLSDRQIMLSEQWCNHEDASTEDLRITMQNYHSFLNNILDH